MVAAPMGGDPLDDDAVLLVRSWLRVPELSVP